MTAWLIVDGAVGLDSGGPGAREIFGAEGESSNRSPPIPYLLTGPRRGKAMDLSAYPSQSRVCNACTLGNASSCPISGEPVVCNSSSWVSPWHEKGRSLINVTMIM